MVPGPPDVETTSKTRVLEVRTISRGFSIDYSVDAEGPPLVLVAGTLLSAKHRHDVGYVAALARDWRVIDVDPLGHGTSDTPHDADSYDAAGVAADRLLAPLAESLRRGDWAPVWKALGISDPHFQQMIEAGNDPLAVSAAIEGSLRPTRFIDPQSITCPAMYYAGADDWILPYVRADVDALCGTLDVIPTWAISGRSLQQPNRCSPH